MPAYLYLHSQSTKIPEGTVAAGVCFIYYTLTYISTATVQSSGYEGHVRGERERIIYAHSCAQLFYPSAYYIYIYTHALLSFSSFLFSSRIRRTTFDRDKTGHAYIHIIYVRLYTSECKGYRRTGWYTLSTGVSRTCGRGYI